MECEATAQARSAMPDTWTCWPRHLRQFLLPVAPESLEWLQQCRSSCADQPWWFDQEAGDGPLHLFTDGSTTHTAWPCLRKAGWAIIWADGHHHRPDEFGLVQTAGRAETMAILQAARWAAAHRKAVILWVDCQSVVQRLQQVLNGASPLPSWANSDLWKALMPSDLLSTIQGVHKVHSHQTPEHLQPGDLWARTMLSTSTPVRQRQPGLKENNLYGRLLQRRSRNNNTGSRP